MTKTIKVCDKCNKEVKWVYPVPQIQIAGYTLTIREGHKAELCENCMNNLIDVIRSFHKTE